VEIAIISKGRPLKQTTFENLPKFLRERATVYVPPNEVYAYLEAGVSPVVGIPVSGIGACRQWCLDHAKEDKVVMVDDDLVFATRRKDEPTKFNPATVDEIEELFAMIDLNLEVYAHVGVATREGGNYNTDDYYTCSRMLRVLAYNRSVLKAEGIRFDRLPVMEDFDVTLQLLRAGHPNFIINYMVQNQNGSNLAGGCSTYRTLGMQEAAALGLKKLHPQFVTVVKKDIKERGAWGERTDVRIQWKKAYDSSGRSSRVLGEREGADTGAS
jgi:hypothetical protein